MNLRTAVVGSVVLHAGLAAALGGGFPGAPVRKPVPRTILAEIPIETPLDLDAPPLPLEPPEESALPPAMPELLDPIPEEADGRFDDPDEPPGPPAEVIGISSIDGRRLGLPGIVGGGRGSGHGRGRARPGPPSPPPVEPPPPAPPVPDPVFLPPTLKADRAPVYPPSVRRAGVEGTVRVRVAVAADGSVGEVTVAVSSGNGALDAAAVEAAASWVFLPATEDGTPVASVVYRFVSFTLTDAR